MSRRVHFGPGATTTIREYQIEKIPGFDSPKMKKLDSRKKKNTVTIQFEQGEHEIQNLSCLTTVNDVIYAMIKTGGESLQSFHPSQLVIVESWRKQERPLPPRTRLLKVWKSWGVEQANVKYYLKQAQSIPFRQSKSWSRHSLRQRRTSRKVQKPESTVEIQIDGPWSVSNDKSTSSSSSSTSLSLSDDSTTSSSASSEASSNSSFGIDQSAERNAMLHQCMEREKYLHSMRLNETKLNNQLAAFVPPPTPPPPRPEVQELLDEIEWTKTRVSALEEQISAVNNTYANLKDKFDELERLEPIESAENILIMFRAFEQMDKLRINIEAQLYLNLSLTAEMQRFETHISDLDRSIEARRALVESQFEYSDDNYCNSESFDCSLSNVSDVDHSSVCHTCPDCRMGTPIHLKTKQLILDADFDVLVKSCSKTSLTDSAISSMSSCLTKDSRLAPKETNL